jgi:hypothetical protein
MELLMLSHVPNRVLEKGFLPAAVDLELNVTLLTDCAKEHLLRARTSPVYRHCKLFDCDIFNPLSVARLIAVHDLKLSGVLAADASVRACAALVAASLGLPGPSWPSALLCDQRSVLRGRFEPPSSSRSRWVVNCSEPDARIDAGSFPVTVQSLETDLDAGGLIARNAEELRRCLAEIRDGYALIEKHRVGDVYALEGLGTPDGFIVLGGSHIRFDDDPRRTKRVQSLMPRPPRCDELLALLSGLDLGLGRHHVEYAVTEKGIRIREIHNGLHDDESEFAVSGQLDGDLFRETINVCLGRPVKSLHRLRTDTTLVHPKLEAAL